MACKDPALRGALPICEMSLRPRPADVFPGRDHLVRIDPERWLRHNHVEEECLCDRPYLEWCVTPLGMAVEVYWGSANHHLCLHADPPRLDLVPQAHPGIAAEALFVLGDLTGFRDIVRGHHVARDHILSIAKSFSGNEGALAEAQHLIRAMLARDAAAGAVAEAIR